MHDLPFKIYPKILTKELILHCVSWLNAFPSENGISKDLSPREIITGKRTNYNTDCRVEFGTFCQIHENNDRTNKDDPRSIDAIALGPTGNRQGTYNFLTLDTWEKVGRNHWTELPMPRQIIDIVNHKGKTEGQKQIPRHNNFTFEWRPSIPFTTTENETNDNNNSDETTDEVNFEVPEPTVVNSTTIDEENEPANNDDENETIDDC